MKGPQNIRPIDLIRNSFTINEFRPPLRQVYSTFTPASSEKRILPDGL